jgi:cyclohexadienyl dehydratase
VVKRLQSLLMGGALIVSACAASMPPVGLDGGRVIRFGVPGDYPPFAQWTAGGEPVGADIQAARQVARALGDEPVFVRTTWPTLAADFSAKRFDVAIGGITVTPERAALGVFGPSMVDGGKRPLARCADRDRYPTLAAIDRPGVRVVINRGAEIAALAKRWFTQAQVILDREDATLTAQLLDAKADVWVTDGPVVDQMARRYPGRLCATTLQPFNPVTKAWLMQNEPRLVAAIDAQLKILIDAGAWRADLDAQH